MDILSLTLSLLLIPLLVQLPPLLAYSMLITNNVCYSQLNHPLIFFRAHQAQL